MSERLRRIRIWIGIGCLSGGGAEKQVELLVGGLDPKRFEVRVGYVRKREAVPDYSENVRKSFYPRGATFRWDQIWRQIHAEFRDWRPDVVHVWLPEVVSIPGAVLGSLRGVPVISSVRRSYFKGIGWRAYGRECLGLIPHLFSRLVVSNFPLTHEPALLRQYFQRRPTRVIRNGVATRMAYTKMPQLNVGDPVHFVFVGRFARQKRLPFLLQTLSRFNAFPWRLTIFGSGSASEQQTLSEFVEAGGMSDKVVFRGFVPNWREESGDFHYMLFPSVSEGMPNVVVESMAEGIPVVGSRIPELVGILKDGVNGFYFEPDASDSLLKVLERLQSENHRQLAIQAMAKAEDFSIPSLIQSYEELYESVYERSTP